MGANMSQKIAGATVGTVVGGCLVVGTSVGILVSQNIPPLMQTFIVAALAKETEKRTITVDRGVKGGETAGAVAAVAAAVGRVAEGVVRGAPAVGGVGGAIIGWEAAEDADSMYDAMTRAIDTNFEMAKHVAENVHQFTAVAFKTEKNAEYKNK